MSHTEKALNRHITDHYEPVKNKQEASWTVTTEELSKKFEKDGHFFSSEEIDEFLVENHFTSISVEGTIYWLLKEK